MDKENIKDIIIGVLLAIILILCGVMTYLVNIKEDEIKDKRVINNFYEIDNLVNNNYLIKVTSKDDTYIKIENDKVLVKNNDTFTEIKGIENPKYVRYESMHGSCNMVYFVLTNDNTLYYANNYLSNGKCNIPSEFTKVTDKKVLNMYAFDSETKRDFPYEFLTIYAQLDNNDLVQVKGTVYNGNEIEYEYNGLGKTFKENHYFMNLIMTKWGYVGDNYLVNSNYLISWNNKLYYNKETNDDNIYQLKDSIELKYNNKSIKIRDGFATFKGKESDDVMNYELDLVYAIGKDNYLYKVNNDNTKLERVFAKKIKTTKYINEEKNIKRYYEITFEDNTVEKYNIINVSTLNKA